MDCSRQIKIIKPNSGIRVGAVFTHIYVYINLNINISPRVSQRMKVSPRFALEGPLVRLGCAAAGCLKLIKEAGVRGEGPRRSTRSRGGSGAAPPKGMWEGEREGGARGPPRHPRERRNFLNLRASPLFYFMPLIGGNLFKTKPFAKASGRF